MTELDNVSRESLVAVVDFLANRNMELEGTLELKGEIIETQRVMIQNHKAAAKEWQQRALEALDELTLSRCETKYARERRDVWIERFITERAEHQRLAEELNPPF